MRTPSKNVEYYIYSRTPLSRTGWFAEYRCIQPPKGHHFFRWCLVGPEGFQEYFKDEPKDSDVDVIRQVGR